MQRQPQVLVVRGCSSRLPGPTWRSIHGKDASGGLGTAPQRPPFRALCRPPCPMRWFIRAKYRATLQTHLPGPLDRTSGAKVLCEIVSRTPGYIYMKRQHCLSVQAQLQPAQPDKSTTAYISCCPGQLFGCVSKPTSLHSFPCSSIRKQSPD